MKDRLIMHRIGKRNITVSDTEIDRILERKGQILDRMSQLDFNPFWHQHRNTLIRDYLRPPRGGEFKISVLEAQLKLVRMPRALRYRSSLFGLESLSISTDHIALLEVENLKKDQILTTITDTFLPYYTRGPPVLEEL